MTERDLSAPRIYDEFLGPAVFQPYAEILIDWASPTPGDRTLDAGCGTGIVTLALAARVGRAGRATGVDFNPGMLAVAREKSAALGLDVDWREASITALPFDDGTFDLVTSQHVLQFIPDRVDALRECRRVLRGGGTITFAVWDVVEKQPLVVAIDDALEPRVQGRPLAAGMIVGDPDALAAEVEAAGFRIERQAQMSRECDMGPVETCAEQWLRATTAGIPTFRQLDTTARDEIIRAVAAELRPEMAKHAVNGRVVAAWHTHLVRAVAA